MILGNIGNVFIVILFRRHQQNTCLIYLISAAVASNIYLLFVGFVQLFPFNCTNESIFVLVLCKLSGYIPSVIGQVAKLTIVFACVDRHMITNDRASFRAFCTSK